MSSLFGGNVSESTRVIIHDTHDNYNNDDFDFRKTKTLMTEYINEKCKTVTNPDVSLDPNDYGLMKAGCEGLYLTRRNNNTTGYLFNIVNGEVYIIEYDTEHDVTCHPDLPFEITLMMLTSGYHNVTPVLLTN
jgi:hypothetical protein